MASVASSDESSPPEPAPQNIPAAALNPVWATAASGGHHAGGAARARGAGARNRPGARGGGSNGSDVGDDPQALGPISLVELEHRHRLTADGAESSLFSDDDEEEQERDGPTKRRRRDDDASEEDEQPTRRKRHSATDPAAAIAAAAFGSGPPLVESVDGDSEAESSSAMGAALVPYRRTFPVRGVTCIGCAAERDIVAKVDEFVKKNSSKMQEDALYRTAAVYWRNTVVQPARKEGVAIAEWPWKEIRSHYQLHVCDAYIQRMDCCRQLASVRKMLELALVRREGERSVMDHKNTDLLLKVIAMQSKELTLLNCNSMPPPPNRPPNRPPGDVAAK